MDSIADSTGSFPIWITSMLLFVLIFLGLAVRVVVKEVGKMRREGYADAESSSHMYVVPGLGTTMADGGKPTGKDGKKD